MTKRFCVRCGKTVDDPEELIEALCPECFVSLYGIVKIVSNLRITYCPKCYAIKVSGKWIRPSNPDEVQGILRDLVFKAIKPSKPIVKIVNIYVEIPEMYSARAYLHIDASIGKKIISKTIDIPIEWQSRLCPVCFKRAGGSYEAVVQIRFFNFDESLDKSLRDLLTSMFSEDIVEIEDVKNGFDVKVTNSFIAKKIADTVRHRVPLVKLTESYGDIRILRDGRKKGKLCISLRILNVKPGDYVVVDNRAYIVEKVTRNSIVLRKSDGSKIRISVHEFIKRFTKT